MVGRRVGARRLIAFAALVAAVPAHAGEVALTFDDLPVFDAVAATAEATAITRKLLAGLRRAHLPATGFVNEIKLEGADRPQRIALLARWLDAGMDLGNHSYSHLAFDDTPVDDYIADVAKGETVTRMLLAARGRSERWYRHPYLQTGPTPEARARFEAWLAVHGYRIAPVSMENSDWQFADRYEDALARRDARGAAQVRRDYLDYTDRIVTWYRLAAIALLGREPAFVFLLHASRLNADSIGALSAILARDGLKAVTLDRAMADPAYGIADSYAGPNGDQWLTRWARTLGRPLPWASLPHVPDAEAGVPAR